MKCLLLVLSALLSLGYCDHLNAYPFSTVLRADGDGNPLFTLHWNFSAAEETITFGVNVSTNGWVGLGISPNGGMTDSDVVIGWVNNDGEVFFHVRQYTSLMHSTYILNIQYWMSKIYISVTLWH